MGRGPGFRADLQKRQTLNTPSTIPQPLLNLPAIRGKARTKKKKKNAKKDLLHSNVAVQKLEFIINSQKKKKKTRENKTA